MSRAIQQEDELAICGHLHQAEIKSSEALLRVNPGEVCGWVSGRCTGVLVDLKEMSAEILDFGRQEIP
jgi:hypothetical protein